MADERTAGTSPAAGGSDHDHPHGEHDHDHPHTNDGHDHPHADDGHDHPHTNDGHDHPHAEDGHDHPHADDGHDHPHGDDGHDHPHGDHDHPHGDHDHDHDHDHEHSKVPAFLAWLPFFHGHSHGPKQLDAAASSGEGLRVTIISFLALAVTALAQVVIVWLSGSVALLADTIHNFGDALSSVPLAIAFLLGRRLANRRYTYGYGRAEDIAGVLIVLLITASAILVGWQSIERLFNPQPIEYVWVVALAAIIGFTGNEVVAQWRIRTGERIGSAALIADGQHARVDGFTSLMVLGAVLGAIIGLPILDPIFGLLITATIVKIVWDQAYVMWLRIMDGIDPAITERATRAAAKSRGVLGVDDVKGRWVGNKLRFEMDVQVSGSLSVAEGHAIAEEVRHQVFHDVDHVGDVVVHLHPDHDADHHAVTRHHTAGRSQDATPAAG